MCYLYNHVKYEVGTHRRNTAACHVARAAVAVEFGFSSAGSNAGGKDCQLDCVVVMQGHGAYGRVEGSEKDS